MIYISKNNTCLHYIYKISWLVDAINIKMADYGAFVGLRTMMNYQDF